MKQGFRKTRDLREKAKAFLPERQQDELSPEEMNFLEAYDQADRRHLTFVEMTREFSLDYNRAYYLRKNFISKGFTFPRLPGDQADRKIEAINRYWQKLKEAPQS